MVSPTKVSCTWLAASSTASISIDIDSLGACLAFYKDFHLVACTGFGEGFPDGEGDSPPRPLAKAEDFGVGEGFGDGTIFFDLARSRADIAGETPVPFGGC